MGRVIGRYALFDALATGGMATVHYGRLLGPVGFARTVAIKRLHPQYASDPEFVSMFLDEARMCARIRHPNVVPTLDVVTTKGELFLVMEYVQGESLGYLMKVANKKGERIPWKVATSIMAGMLHGLHAAHDAKDEQGVPLELVHRDVSPQNVLVGSDGMARVLDFGIAKAAGRLHVTRENAVKGKLGYMAPEQMAAERVTRQADVYAAAVVLWEALAGRRLFDGESEAIVLSRVIAGEVKPPSSLNPEVPKALDEVVMKGLSRDLDARHKTAKELAQAVERVGVASLGEVGEWVDHTARPILEKRAARLAAVENGAAGLAPSSVTTEPPDALDPRASQPTITPLPRIPSNLTPGSRGSHSSLLTPDPRGSHPSLLTPQPTLSTSPKALVTDSETYVRAGPGSGRSPRAPSSAEILLTSSGKTFQWVAISVVGVVALGIVAFWAISSSRSSDAAAARGPLDAEATAPAGASAAPSTTATATATAVALETASTASSEVTSSASSSASINASSSAPRVWSAAPRPSGKSPFNLGGRN
jgi:serine/threonine protein kinase